MEFFILITEAILFIVLFFICAIRGIINKRMLIFIPIACAASLFISLFMLSYVADVVEILTDNSLISANVSVAITSFCIFSMVYVFLLRCSWLLQSYLSRIERVLISLLIACSFPLVLVSMISIVASFKGNL